MKKSLSVLLILSLILSACENANKKQKATNPDQKLKVFTVNYPLYYFAERIGDEFIDLIYPIPNDVDPAYWVPTQSLEDIQSCDIILANGADYAKWMGKVSLPSAKVVNTSEAFTESFIKIEEGATHSHGASGEHVHYGYAFTTWLDFKIAAGQAEAIKDAFIEKLPKHKAAISENFDELKSELTELDRSMVSIGNKLQGQTLFASHPVYQYLAQAYGLDIISEHWEPGEMPDDKQWDDFKHNLDHNTSNFMLWEGEPGQDIKDSLKSLGITTVLFGPCSNKPKASNFMEIMRENVKNMMVVISADMK